MLTLPLREGPRPCTTERIPHSQLDQQPRDARHLQVLLSEAAHWPHVRTQESRISVEGAQALVLEDSFSAGPPEAFLVETEFCHGHAGGDFSMHACLPLDSAQAACDAGWAEPHFLVRSGQVPATVVMLYAPRDGDECTVMLDLLRTSYDFAHTSTGS